MDKQSQLTSLSELARDKQLDINKSRLTYYAKLGLIVPVDTISRTQIYDKKEVIKAVKLIDRLQESNFTLSEIKEMWKEKG